MADIDLTQYNGVASFPATADVGTAADPFLTPTDGELVTALSNLTGEAPVGPALHRSKDLILGLRDGIVGDRLTAARKSLKSVRVDPTGGAPHSLPGGTVSISGTGNFHDVALGVDIGTIQTGKGDVITLDGDMIATDGHFEATTGGRSGILSHYLVSFTATGTGAADANPPQSTPIPNQLRAINMPKASACIRMTTAGVVDRFPGFGVASVVPGTYGGKGGFLVTFVTAFDNTDYVFEPGSAITDGAALYFPRDVLVARTAATCFLYVQAIGMGVLDPNAVAVDGVQFSVSGQQTT